MVMEGDDYIVSLHTAQHNYGVRLVSILEANTYPERHRLVEDKYRSWIL